MAEDAGRDKPNRSVVDGRIRNATGYSGAPFPAQAAPAPFTKG
jgi:hypothetical protein